MLFQQKIYLTIQNAKFFSRDLLTKIVAMENNGEEVISQKNQFIVLGEWIRILQNYLDNNFDSNGNITPVNVCLSLKQIEELISKVKEVIGNNRYILDKWILAYGYFQDAGVWQDSAQWNDFCPLN